MASWTENYIIESVSTSPSTNDQHSSRTSVHASFYIALYLIILLSLIAHILAIMTGRRTKQDIRTGLIEVTDEPIIKVHTLLFNALLRVDFAAVLYYVVRGFLSGSILSHSAANKGFRCVVDGGSGIFFTWSSGFINILLFVERVFALRTPYFYRKHATTTKAKNAVGFSVIFALFLTVLPVIGFGSYVETIDDVVVCVSPGDIGISTSKYQLHFTILFLVVGFTVIVSIVLGNFVLMYYLVRMRRRVVPHPPPVVITDESNQTCTVETTNEPTVVTSVVDTSVRSPRCRHVKRTKNSNSGSRVSNEVRTVLVLSCVAAAYMISWLPLYTDRLLTTFSIPVSDTIFYLSIWLISFNHVIDPFIFVLLKKRNRTTLKMIFKEKCGRRTTTSDDERTG